MIRAMPKSTTAGVRCSATGAQADIDDLQGEIQELFADLWQVPRFAGSARGLPAARRLLPHRRSAELTVVVELPGVDPDDGRARRRRGHALSSPASAIGRAASGQVYQQMEIDYGAVPAPDRSSARTSTSRKRTRDVRARHAHDRAADRAERPPRASAWRSR